jgi:hypothetical protein
MQRNQIQLLGKRLGDNYLDVKHNKIFFNSLYNCDKLEDRASWFDILDASVSWHRRIDDEMNFEKFFKIMNKDTDILMKLGSPQKDLIQYCAICDFKGISRFAWIACSYNLLNYNLINDLFARAFNKNLDSFEVKDYLKKYHQRRELD